MAIRIILLSVFMLGFIAGCLFNFAIADEVCYEQYDSPEVTQTHSVTNLLITVNWIIDDIGDAEALSECEVHEDHNIAYCEIWVRKPARILGDPAMDALGHEVLHGLLGGFHGD